LPAQSATSTVGGRVLNATSGEYLNNARITIGGTRLDAFTNAHGEYRLVGLPTGPAWIAATFTGLQTQVATVTRIGGTVARNDISLSRTGDSNSVVRLSEFVIANNREMNACDIASNEQRYVPDKKNVVAADAFGHSGEGNLGEFIKFVPGVTVNY
jgi:hypothetical protein